MTSVCQIEEELSHDLGRGMRTLRSEVSVSLQVRQHLVIVERVLCILTRMLRKSKYIFREIREEANRPGVRNEGSTTDKLICMIFEV